MLTLSPITIVARKQDDNVTQAKQMLIDFLSQHSLDFQLDNHPHSLRGISDHGRIKKVSLSDVKTGVLISLGGDGSLLRLVSHASSFQIPLIGINLGRIGFLTDLTMNSLDKLLDILQGEFVQESRFLLQVFHENQTAKEPLGVALNDIIISGDKLGKNLDFSVDIDQKTHFHHHADGFIISTPTGSTAYSLSAGGPIIHPDVATQLLIPICSHKLNTRAIALPPQTPISIKLGSLVNRSATILADGNCVGSLKPNQSIHIRPHHNKLKLIHPKDYCFLSTAQNKLQLETLSHAKKHSH